MYMPMTHKIGTHLITRKTFKILLKTKIILNKSSLKIERI